MAKVKPTQPYQGKVNIPFIKVISIFLNHPHREYSGYDIVKMTKLQSGTIYPMLGRLLEDGWLESEWEKENPKKGRPPRLFYNLTCEGTKEALKVLESLISPNIEKCFEPSLVSTNYM